MTPQGTNGPRRDRWERFIRDRRRALLQAWLGGVAYPGFVILLASIGTTIVVRTTGVPVPFNPTAIVRAVFVAVIPVVVLLPVYRRRYPSPFRMYGAAHHLAIDLSRGASFPGALRSAAGRVESRRVRLALVEAARRCDAGIQPTVAIAGAGMPRELRACVSDALNRDDLVRRLEAEIDRYDQGERLRVARLAAIIRPAGILIGGAVLLYLVARIYLPALETLTTIPMEGL